MGNAHVRTGTDRGGEFAPRSQGIVDSLSDDQQKEVGIQEQNGITTAQFGMPSETTIDDTSGLIINEPLDDYVYDVSELIRENGYVVSTEDDEFTHEDAQQVFTTVVEESDIPRHERMNPPTSASPDRIGGLPHFSPSDSGYTKQTLTEIGYDGHRNGNMIRYDDENGNHIAYVFHMNKPNEQSHIAHRELVGSSVFETLNLPTPRHEYDTVDNWVASEAWGTDLEPTITHEQGYDTVTAAIISGNFDIKAENMKQKTTGEYSVIDHDRAGGKMWQQDSSYSWGDYKQSIQRATFTLRQHTGNHSLKASDVHSAVQSRTEQIVKRGGLQTIARNVGAYNEDMAKNVVGNVATILLVDDINSFEETDALNVLTDN